MSKLCDADACVKLTLNKMVCETVSSCALDIYAYIVEFLRNTFCIDLNLFFKVIALLSVICWVQLWIVEMIKFVCKIPKIIKKMLCGKFNFCLLGCDCKPVHKTESESCSKSESKSKSKSKSECKSTKKHSCSSSSY